MPEGRLCNRVSETPVIGEFDREDMLKMAMERAGMAEPPVMPMEATAKLAMLLRRRSAIARRSEDCSSATPPRPGGIDRLSRLDIRSSPVETHTSLRRGEWR